MNIALKLRERELRASSRMMHHRKAREMIPLAAFPNKTLHNVTSPYPSVFRKFTPDGKFLVSFSLGKSAVHLYRYHGPNIDTTDEDTVDSQVLFSRFLSPVYEKTLTTGNEVLCRDFCMFTKNPNRMILASAVTSSLAGAESSSPSRSFPHSLDWIGSLDDLTFWVLDIATGKVLGKKIYLNDYVYLTNHSGVHMFDDYLAIASVQHQSIYINLIRDDGSLIELQCIGWNLFEDDELLAMRYNQNQMDFDEQQGREKRRRIQLSSSSDSSEIMDESSSFPVLLITEEEQDSKKPVQMLSGLKQRLMSFLFRKANMAPRSLNYFNLTFGYFKSLVLWRVQFIDTDRILIKFGSRENISGKISEPSLTHTSFFVMYNYKTTEIDEVFDNTSLELLDIYKRSSMLVGNISDDSSQYLSSPGNNIYAHDLMEQLMLAVRKARNGGSELAVKRVVSGLPHNSQSFFETPLFDHSLFLWDDKIVSSYDRIRLSSEFPLKFYNRKSGRLLFKIDPQEIPYGSPPIQNYANSQSKKTITFIFHPTDPFCITQQSSRTQSNLNIHFKAS